ncbi:MAG: aminoacyl-histidine dipeptidase [Lachnobacterium sp.]|nr:aminoacyl-histidine dipeptidase [Lachnobacterium sp.]
MRALENLKPENVFYYFEEIANIPHGSRNTKQISDYLVNFAKERNLEHYQDELNNVVIIKEASEGYESAEPVIIQGHMDMVCEKENGSTIDFEKDGLELYVDDGFVKAKDTTLGGDDGIAVAYALALLDSKELKHPRLEVVITVDEEIGMLGAVDIDLSMLKGHIMLNIDSDVEGEFLTSCAGGMSINSSIPVTRTSQTGLETIITLTGLDGGHSGAEIHKEHGNANILMGRILENIFNELPFGILDIKGGLKDNAIPRECTVTLLIPEEAREDVTRIVNATAKELAAELSVADPATRIDLSFGNVTEKNVLDYASVNKIILYLRTVPNGVINMSQVITGLVETSLNLGILELKDNELSSLTSIRSSVATRKDDLKKRVMNIIEMLGGECEAEGEYPAWEYNDHSTLRPQVVKVYQELFGEEPKLTAIHAGLECGILSDKIPNLDCVSFGPTNYDIHTPKERLSISSTEKYWNFLVKFLEEAK